jgi:hypothetical protein
MNPAFRKKIPMFILFCILLGIVFYFVTSNSNFGKVDPYPAGSGTSKVGYAMSSSWDSVWTANSNLKNFFFPDPNGTEAVPNVPRYKYDLPTAAYVPANISVTAYNEIVNTTRFPLEDYRTLESDFNAPSSITNVSYGGEYGLFNYIIHNDQRITAYMSNDFKLIPLELKSTATVGVYQAQKIDMSNIKSILGISLTTYNLGYYTLNSMGSALSTAQTVLSNLAATTPTDLPALSFNNAILVPTNMTVTSAVGTAGSNNASWSTNPINNFYKLRLKIIIGVLTSMHLLLNGSPAVIPDNFSGAMPTTASLGNTYPTGAAGTTTAAPTRAKGPEGWSIAYDLKNIYNPGVNSSAAYKPWYWTNTVTPTSVGGTANANMVAFESKHIPSNYVLHSLYLIVTARNSWINNIISSPTNLKKI